MRLHLEKLPSFQNVLVTPVTAETANKDAGSKCHQRFEGLVTPVTKEAESVTTQIVTGDNWRQKTASKDAGVIAVTTVTAEKHQYSKSSLLDGAFLIQDPSYFADDFARWALAECVFHDRCAFGVKTLHPAFCDWCKEQDTVGCMIETFYALVEDAGLTISIGLVNGLALSRDLGQLQREYPSLRRKQA